MRALTDFFPEMANLGRKPGCLSHMCAFLLIAEVKNRTAGLTYSYIGI